jgi:S1-C subfamily serine protease
MADNDVPTSENQLTDSPADSSTPTWREHFHAARARGGEARRRWVFAVLVLLVAAVAGFIGGRVGSHGDYVSGSLSAQKQIVTSQGELINKIAKDVGPSVVSVNVTTQTTTSGFFGIGSQTSQEQAAGTGIIISSNGVIMTNRHVVPAGTTSVSITLSDGTQFDNVKVLGRTSSSDSIDVAFLKIQNLKGHKLTPAVIGDSSGAKVGDSVVAIGNALGEFQNTVTSGIISGFGRQVQASSDNSDGSQSAASSEDLDNLIQTDAAINEGNSGGPLVNLNGEVIGMNTAIASDAENIGFAIPIDDIKGLISQVLKSGTFSRPFLGVRYFSLTPAVAKEYALPVSQGAYLAPSGISGSSPVVPGSPAERAGLQAGDIVTEVNGKSVDYKHSLTTLLNHYQPGDEVTLKVLRDGKTISVHVTLGTSPSSS